MSTVRPGDYITAKCTRCNDVTGHVATVVLDGMILKVECKACGSIHKYRDAPKVKSPREQAPSVRKVRAGDSRVNAVELGGSTRKSPKTASTTRKAVTARSSQSKIESAWQEAMVRLNALTPIPYSMNGQFECHTVVDHPTFGRGEVINLIKPDKIEVLFQEGVKILRCQPF